MVKAHGAPTVRVGRAALAGSPMAALAPAHGDPAGSRMAGLAPAHGDPVPGSPEGPDGFSQQEQSAR